MDNRKNSMTFKMRQAIDSLDMREPLLLAPDQYEVYIPSFQGKLGLPHHATAPRIIGKGDYSPPLSPGQLEAYELELERLVAQEAAEGDLPLSDEQVEELIERYEEDSENSA